VSKSELKIQLWKAFWLGARTTVLAYDIPEREANREKYIDLLGRIASGDQTLNNPAEMAAMFQDPRTATVAFKNEHELVRADRELARQILDGMADDLGVTE
jgi:hypothetical protein